MPASHLRLFFLLLLSSCALLKAGFSLSKSESSFHVIKTFYRILAIPMLADLYCMLASYPSSPLETRPHMQIIDVGDTKCYIDHIAIQSPQFCFFIFLYGSWYLSHFPSGLVLTLTSHATAPLHCFFFSNTYNLCFSCFYHLVSIGICILSPQWAHNSCIIGNKITHLLNLPL